MLIEVPGWAVALAVLLYLSGGFITAALISVLRRQNNIYARLYRERTADLEITRRQLRHARSELGHPKPFGDVVERGPAK